MSASGLDRPATRSEGRKEEGRGQGVRLCTDLTKKVSGASETRWFISTTHSRARSLVNTHAKPRLLPSFYSTRRYLVCLRASDVSSKKGSVCACAEL